MAKPIHDLTALMAEFPGIGPRQARRIVQFLLAKDGAYRTRLSELVKDIRNHVSQCSVCFRFDEMDGKTTCKICSDGTRDATLLMVVEKDVDIEGVETSGAYKGRYFVLGGLMPLTQRKNAPVLRTKELTARVEKNGIKEIIFALSTTPEGDYTAREIAQHLVRTQEPQSKANHPRISLLGRGLSVGAEIEYADGETLRQAIRGRQLE